MHGMATDRLFSFLFVTLGIPVYSGVRGSTAPALHDARSAHDVLCVCVPSVSAPLAPALKSLTHHHPHLPPSRVRLRSRAKVGILKGVETVRKGRPGDGCAAGGVSSCVPPVKLRARARVAPSFAAARCRHDHGLAEPTCREIPTACRSRLGGIWAYKPPEEPCMCITCTVHARVVVIVVCC